MITVQELLDLFHYDPDTGHLIWKVSLARRIKVDSIAGCKSTDGRILIGIRGRLYKAHRIIWAMVTGKWPEKHVDHINNDPSDNRWINLRLATQSENMRNMKATKANTSGVKGVSWQKNSSKWRAYVILDGKQYHLGLFDDKENAIKARKEAADRLHGVFVKHQ